MSFALVARRTLGRPLAAALLLAAGSAAANAQTFTFETVGNSYSYVGSTYAPFVFAGTAQVMADPGPYGTLDCATSGSYCLYNGNGDQNVDLARSDAAAFTFNSGYFTSWFGSTSATIAGFLGGTQVFSQTFALGSTAAFQSFGNAVVDLVQFRAANGNGAGYFLADDVTVGSAAVPPGPGTVAPEPASLALLGGGLVMLAGVARRRRA